MSKYFISADLENLCKGSLDASRKPVLEIPSGATVTFETVSKLGTTIPFSELLKEHGYEIEDNPLFPKIIASEELASPFPASHVLTGPIYVKDAEPGDVLEVHIDKLELTTPFANARVAPGLGGLPDLVPSARSYMAVFNEEKNEATFIGETIPLAPFLGIMGNAPDHSVSSSPPQVYGGNIDCKELVEGTTLFLPIAVPGALFYTGDGHAAQGDGEVSVTALETSLTATLTFTLHKAMPLTAPMGITSKEYLFFGFAATLDEAMRMALTNAVNYIMQQKGLSFEEALALASIICDLHITQVVNGIVGVHASVPLKYFR